MAQAAPSRTKINTKPTQAASGQASRRPAGRGKARCPARGQARMASDACRSTRDPRWAYNAYLKGVPVLAGHRGSE